MKFFGSMRTRLGLALGAALAAAVAVVIVIPATFGSFSDQTTNSGNSAGLGTLLVTNGAGTCTGGGNNTSTCAAVISFNNFKPGDTRTYTVTLTNSGTLRGIYQMKLASATNHLGPNSNGVGTASDVGAQLNLEVTDNNSNVIYGVSACTGATSAGTHPLSSFTSNATLPPTTNTDSDNSW